MEIKIILETLLAGSENEIVEFKEAKNNFDSKELKKYFSALSNEANLANVESAWLIFGVNDKREIIGTQYRNDKNSLNRLKKEIAENLTNKISFKTIHTLLTEKGRVILFEIPPAPRGVPIAFNGHYYARINESLEALGIEKLDAIRNQNSREDWSSMIVKEASISDLDEDALYKARKEFKQKNKNNSRLSLEEIDNWDNATFLAKSGITKAGGITNSALLLLGKEDAAHLLSPAVGKITWILKDEDGIEVDYKHFGIPFILKADDVLSKIRNITFRRISGNTLFPEETSQYDNYVIREALHNSIAHQDYSLCERISVVEYPDMLVFSNGGDFIPDRVENVIQQDAPQRHYRNQYLCDVMVNLNMIDTIGSGIKKMYVTQRKRLFPMPDYIINRPESVTVKIYSKVIDVNYVRLLKMNLDLSLMDVILLDRVQKKMQIPEEFIKELRKRGLIDGRKPNFFIAEKLAKENNELGQFVKNKAFDRKYYKDLILSFLEKQIKASRADIDNLLWDKLSDVLDENQKKNYIRNLLSQMKKEGTLLNVNGKRWSLNNEK